MFTDMLRRDRERWGMTEAQTARRFRVSLRDYREIEAGERDPDFATYDAICKLFGWPQAFVQSGSV
jgi:transcriptional regulator with XRE-family HTH domain